MKGMVSVIALTFGGGALFVASAPLSSPELRYSAAVHRGELQVSAIAAGLGLLLVSWVLLRLFRRDARFSLLIAAAGAAAIWAFVVATNPLRGFEGVAEPLAALAGLQRDSSEAYTTGKLFAFDTRLERASGVYFALPPERRARRLEEVGTVARIDCRDKPVGIYTDGKRALQFECELHVIDRARKTIVARKTFLGDDPPLTKSNTWEGWGALPNEEMARYLANLPVR